MLPNFFHTQHLTITRIKPNKGGSGMLWIRFYQKQLLILFGTRCESTLESLLKKLENFKVTFYFTDGLGSYGRLLDSKKHIVSKKYTQQIECSNLNCRARCKRLARKICFSKSSDIHDKVIVVLLLNALPSNMSICKIEALHFIC